MNRRARSHRVLALEIDDDGVLAIEAHTTADSGLVEHVFESPWPENAGYRESPEAAGLWLRREMLSLGCKASIVRVVLKRDQCIVRRITVPVADEDETHQMIAYQAAGQLSVPAREVVVDYVQQRITDDATSLDVLLMAVPMRTVETLSSICAAAELQLDSISVRAARILPLLPSAMSGVVVIVDRETTEIAAVSSGRLLQSTSLHTDGAAQRPTQIASGINRLRATLAESDQLLLNAVHVCGHSAEHHQLAGEIGHHLDVAPEFLDANSLVGGLPSLERNPIACIGAVVIAQRPAIEFIADQFADAKRIRRWRGLLVSAACCVAVACGMWGMRDTDDTAGEIAMLKAQERRLATRIRERQDILETASRLQNWGSKKTDWLSSVDSFLGEFPTDRSVFLNALHFETGPDGNRIHADGYAQNRQTVMELNERLLARPDYVVVPHGMRPSRANMEYGLRFEVEARFETAANPSQERTIR